MGRPRVPAESEGRPSCRRAPDAKMRKPYFLLRLTQDIVARGFHAAKLAKRRSRDGPSPPAPATEKRTWARNAGNVYPWSDFVYFIRFICQPHSSHPPPRGFFRRSNVGPEGYFVAKLRESRGCRPKPVEPRFAPEFCWLL